jgi:RHH-type transcriptional regulator, rel operon repressor / antitoxin RelB
VSGQAPPRRTNRFERFARTKPGNVPAGALRVSVCIQHTTRMSEVMTIRVDRKTKGRLEKLARAMERSKSYLAAEAIRAYVELNEWQIAEIKAALKEADAGDFASDKEVDRVVKKWRRGAGKVA